MAAGQPSWRYRTMVHGAPGDANNPSQLQVKLFILLDQSITFAVQQKKKKSDARSISEMRSHPTELRNTDK